MSVYIFENHSTVMKLPQELLCEIFSYLEDHPVHFTRIAQVCRSWNLAADNHLFWRRLTKNLQLPDPRPRAYKYKTHKSIILKNWGNFCTLCNVKKMRNNGLLIRPVLVDVNRISKIDFDSSSFFKVVLKNSDAQKEQILNHGDSGELPPQFLNHLLCCRCHLIYEKYNLEENVRIRRDLLSAKLGEINLTLPNRHYHCDRFIFFGKGNPTKIARKLSKTHFA